MAYPVGVFKTADDYVTIAVFSEKFWRSFCRAIGKGELISDVRFDSPQKRLDNKQELKSIISALFLTKKTQDWIDLLGKFDVPCGPVHDYDNMITDPQVAFNE